MFLDLYYSESNSQILITKDQASNFAKKIAHDFNPLHDPENARFCVPGDLLFSLVLAKCGLYQKMSFEFSGMVGEDVPLIFPDNAGQNFSITDQKEKEYLHIETEGDVSNDKKMIAKLAEGYVEFSGKTFPDLIVPLMKEHDVMINPNRPMVIYQSMSIELDTISITEPSLVLHGTSLSVQGRKGIVLVEFDVKSEEKVIGKGIKTLALRGLSKFDQSTVDQIVDDYQARKNHFESI
ncbi:MAG: DUF3581 family protein [Gammaproteobacteria bacterium]